MRLTSRQIFLGAAFTGTVALAFFTAEPVDTGVVEAAGHARPAFAHFKVPAKRSSAAASTEDGQVQETFADPGSDPFKVVSFVPPPPPVAAAPVPAEAPPVPSAPPFPYRYFGKMTGTDGKPVIYLARGDDLVPIHEHGILDNTYRVDSISDSSVTVTYLPLGTSTELPTFSAEQ